MLTVPGVVRQSRHSDEANSQYLGILYDDSDLDLLVEADAETAGNEFRYLNDYRNISSRPNVKLDSVPVGGSWHILVVAIEDIKKGEELLIDYGSFYWESDEEEAGHQGSEDKVIFRKAFMLK